MSEQLSHLQSKEGRCGRVEKKQKVWEIQGKPEIGAAI